MRDFILTLTRYNQNLSILLVSRFPWISFDRPDIQVIDIHVKSMDKEETINILVDRLKKTEQFIRLCVDISWNQWQDLFHLSLVIQKLEFLLKSDSKTNEEEGDLTKQFIKKQGIIKNILSGSDALKCQELLIADLNVIESFLIMASFIAGRNTIKHDLLVFAKGKKFNRGRKRGPKTKNKKKLQKPIKVKFFSLDRLLAIFTFIFPADKSMPSQLIILVTINKLVKRGLIKRFSPPDRIDNVKFECIVKFEMVEAIAKKNNLILDHYFSKDI